MKRLVDCPYATSQSDSEATIVVSPGLLGTARPSYLACRNVYFHAFSLGPIMRTALPCGGTRASTSLDNDIEVSTFVLS